MNSPLRYPGGKSCLYSLTADILRLNGLERGHYAEPYAGGFGLALSLLYGGHVGDVHLNDIDVSIWSFWHSVLNDTSNLIDMINSVKVDIDEWLRQKDIYRNSESYDTLSVAFATFFLNRTNRSGIIKGGGVIGGLDQTGLYKIDCRFNKPDLVSRISRISKYKHRIHLSKLDALSFMGSLDHELPESSLWFIDPPYYRKGAELYTSFYRRDDHVEVAKSVFELQRPSIVTYDDTPEIRLIYNERRQYTFDISYSLATKKRGTELLIASNDLRLPDIFRDREIYKEEHQAA